VRADVEADGQVSCGKLWSIEVDCFHLRKEQQIAGWLPPTLVDISLAQRRILLTRDRALLKRRIITHGVFVHADDPEAQTLEVIRRLDLSERLAPLTRCLRCNGDLIAVSKEEVIDRLEPLTRRYYSDFVRCAQCSRIYWPGSHHARMQCLVERLRRRVGERNDEV
jgi:uncharacterized protein